MELKANWSYYEIDIRNILTSEKSRLCYADGHKFIPKGWEEIPNSKYLFFNTDENARVIMFDKNRDGQIVDGELKVNYHNKDKQWKPVVSWE